MVTHRVSHIECSHIECSHIECSHIEWSHIECSHIECSHIECSHRVVTHRVLIYRVSIEWSHKECSHRVVTHTLHFVFIFTLFGVSCRDNFISPRGMSKYESFCGSNLRLPVLVVHAHTLPTGAGLTVPPAIPVQPMVLQMAGRHDAGVSLTWQSNSNL